MIEITDEKVKKIYKKVNTERMQISTQTQKETNELLFTRLNHLCNSMLKIMSKPESRKQHDDMKRDLSNLLDYVVMNTDHDVIMELSNEFIFDYLKQKQLKNVK